MNASLPDGESGNEFFVSSRDKVERAVRRPETTGELDVTAVFYEAAEAISPAFVRGDSDSVTYGGGYELKRGHELSPGVFTPVDVTYTIELMRDFVTLDTEELGVTPDDSTSEFDEDDESGDEGSVGLLDYANDEDDEAPNTNITTLRVLEEREHQIGEIPKDLHDYAEQRGWLQHDGEDKFYVQQKVGYVVFLSEGVIERAVSFRFSVNGYRFDEEINIGEMVEQDIIKADIQAQPQIRHTQQEDVLAWEAELGDQVGAVESEMIDFEQVAALSTQFKLEDRQPEYAKEVAHILWQVLRVPVSGFTDEHAPDRL